MLYDITPPITESLTVWPGDTPPAREILMDIRKGDVVTLSTLRATVHLGAHADGPNHYTAEAPGVGELPLEAFLGPCQVIRVSVARGSRVEPAMIGEGIRAPRVLLHTGTFPDRRRFHEDFAPIAPETIEHLAGRGVRLIGTDAPSVDPFDSKALPAHKMCLKHDVLILEGLLLTDVPDGVYELIALPLRLIGFDGSPVRAVLRSLP